MTHDGFLEELCTFLAGERPEMEMTSVYALMEEVESKLDDYEEAVMGRRQIDETTIFSLQIGYRLVETLDTLANILDHISSTVSDWQNDSKGATDERQP